MDYNKKLTFEGLQYYHSKIKTLFSNVNKSISDETTRATTKENEIAAKFEELNENKSDAVIDTSTGKKVVFTIENGIICAREA